MSPDFAFHLLEHTLKGRPNESHGDRRSYQHRSIGRGVSHRPDNPALPDLEAPGKEGQMKKPKRIRMVLFDRRFTCEGRPTNREGGPAEYPPLR